MGEDPISIPLLSPLSLPPLEQLVPSGNQQTHPCARIVDNKKGGRLHKLFILELYTWPADPKSPRIVMPNHTGKLKGYLKSIRCHSPGNRVPVTNVHTGTNGKIDPPMEWSGEPGH